MSESATALRGRARKCRETALETTLENVAAALHEIALDCARQANRIDRAEAEERERLKGDSGKQAKSAP